MMIRVWGLWMVTGFSIVFAGENQLWRRMSNALLGSGMSPTFLRSFRPRQRLVLYDPLPLLNHDVDDGVFSSFSRFFDVKRIRKMKTDGIRWLLHGYLHGPDD
jgi:hypothetical protein